MEVWPGLASFEGFSVGEVRLMNKIRSLTVLCTITSLTLVKSHSADALLHADAYSMLRPGAEGPGSVLQVC